MDGNRGKRGVDMIKNWGRMEVIDMLFKVHVSSARAKLKENQENPRMTVSAENPLLARHAKQVIAIPQE